ncbi:hypothetical protein [Streptomyces thermocarboxydovorans]|uniref:hypothetical protein n=1 Tax=Streptomyces thermocarboxydovorans TaxID=59298 RepID=UPI0031E27A7D
MAELARLTEEALRHPGLAGNSADYVYLLSALLGFEGIGVWSEELDGLNDEEYEVPCPACGAENFIVIGEHGFFSTVDSMYMDSDAGRRVPLQPRSPSSLGGWA